MKKHLINITLLAAFLVGCGGGGGGDGIDLDATVVYKTTGAYDLRDYTLPLKNGLNVYMEKVYINKNGKKSFKDDPEENAYTEKYDINSTTVVVRDGDDRIDSVKIIKTDRILDKDDFDDDSALEIARFANDGDYVVSYSENKTEEGGIPVKSKTVCRVVGHYDSKKVGNKTYSDILKITCKQNTNGSLENPNVEFSYSLDGEAEIFFAKGIGEIYSEDITCSSINTILNDNETKNSTCKKDITKIIAHD